MYKALSSRLLFVAMAAMVPVVSHQPVSAGRHDCCCRVCRQPQCCCAKPVSAPACQAVVETQYTQQPVLQQRDVVTTEYRNEPVTETVPSTIYENVMVDEGGYQTVWVPKLTTKSVARTIYTTRTTCRTVPYQVTRRISEYGTQSVPQQTVRYIPANSGTVISSVPYRSSSSSSIAALPSPTTTVISSSNSVGVVPTPVPDPRFAGVAATPIGPKSVSNGSSSKTASSVQSADRGPSLFTPAPSAAQVWRTPRGSAIR